MGFLRIDKHAVAMQLAVQHGDVHWILKIGYDDSVARCSPGNLLTSAMIADAVRRGLCRYEFLGWPAQWIEAWTGPQHDLVTIAKSPLRVRGLAACRSGS